MSKTDSRDKKLENKLDKLFKPWEKKLKEKLEGKLQGEKFGFITDGALPGYSKQELKILFIGREAHSGTRSIVDHVVGVRDPDQEAFHTELKNIDGSTRGRNCWSRALRITYGLIHGVEKWDDIPKLDYFRKSFGEPKDISFAIIEASKYANPKRKDLSKIFADCAYESLEFIRKEIDLLDPHLIISWNLRGAFNKDKDGNKGNNGDCFLKELTGSDSFKEPSKNVRIWKYKPSKGREIPLLDTWHLSTPNKSPRRHIYAPIRKALKELGLI